MISEITFGIGHIVNLLRGFGYEELMGHIIIAIAIWIVLALFVAITKNIIAGILFHIVFKISGAITRSESYEVYLTISILSIVLCYTYHTKTVSAYTNLRYSTVVVYFRCSLTTI
ncbi:hypothetical protein [Clostridium sp.]|uniref:hypothetical protein n=1 Tax=Clostridium sp. TaxID=1506 RepID=UPI003D6D7D09